MCMYEEWYRPSIVVPDAHYYLDRVTLAVSELSSGTEELRRYVGR